MIHWLSQHVRVVHITAGIDRLEEEAARQQESHQQSCSDMPMRISGDASSGNAANAMRSSKDGKPIDALQHGKQSRFDPSSTAINHNEHVPGTLVSELPVIFTASSV